jgi:hypothetical protein
MFKFFFASTLSRSVLLELPLFVRESQEKTRPPGVLVGASLRISNKYGSVTA